MHRSSRLLALFATASLCAPCVAATPNGSGASTNGSDIASIYKTFLSRWSEKAEGPRNVAKSADAPTADDMKQYAECAKELGSSSARLVCARTTAGNTMLRSSLVRTGTTSKWFATNPRPDCSSGGGTARVACA